ncbi:hypothetical protein BJY01DRAFT_116562 [Aspergillus pseudoustus]|uniref:Uncharacterized protein n=1 Tax=Aspergillus pseudoustus TaxID=1810923 RepID=A0ABR4KGR3_9EURO
MLSFPASHTPRIKGKYFVTRTRLTADSIVASFCIIATCKADLPLPLDWRMSICSGKKPKLLSNVVEPGKSPANENRTRANGLRRWVGLTWIIIAMSIGEVRWVCSFGDFFLSVGFYFFVSHESLFSFEILKLVVRQDHGAHLRCLDDVYGEGSIHPIYKRDAHSVTDGLVTRHTSLPNETYSKISQFSAQSPSGLCWRPLIIFCKSKRGLHSGVTPPWTKSMRCQRSPLRRYLKVRGKKKERKKKKKTRLKRRSSRSESADDYRRAAYRSHSITEHHLSILLHVCSAVYTYTPYTG